MKYFPFQTASGVDCSVRMGRARWRQRWFSGTDEETGRCPAKAPQHQTRQTPAEAAPWALLLEEAYMRQSVKEGKECDG